MEYTENTKRRKKESLINEYFVIRMVGYLVKKRKLA